MPKQSQVVYKTRATAATRRAPAPPAILVAAPVNSAGADAVAELGDIGRPVVAEGRRVVVLD